MERALKILFVTSELAPLVSTGGLADVAFALPKALKAQGHDVRLALPCYRSLTEKQRGDQYCLCVADMGGKMAHGALRLSSVTDTRIPLYLVEHEGYFGREKPYGVGAYEYDDNAERFSFFCQALLHGISQTGWKPDVIHCNDWHTAPIPALIKTRFAGDPFWGGMPTLFTIHNMAYQGRYPAVKYAATGLPPELLNPDCMEYEGDMNLMKGAIAFASKLSTVSPRYAKEIQTLEYGAGLDGMLRTRAGDLSGILNGVDYELWNPRSDRHLPVNYRRDELSGKARCKAAFQGTLGLPERKVPLIGVVGRLFWQKGIDLLLDALPQIMDLELQLVVLGTGDPDLETRIRAAAEQYPDKVRAVLRFDIPLAHEIQAASDFMLMPSRYEPCGLNQLYAMAYGAIPIVRRTGGLADSVADVNPVNLRHGHATGISFVPLTPAAVIRSLRRALEMYRQPEVLGQVRAAGMAADFSWDRSCRAYVQLYQETMLRP